MSLEDNGVMVRIHDEKLWAEKLGGWSINSRVKPAAHLHSGALGVSTYES